MDLGPQPINPLTQSFWPNGPGRPQPNYPSHTSAAICLFTLHCSTTQYLWALATHSKLLILHFTMHSTFSKLKTHTHTHTHPQHTLQTNTKTPPHNSPLSSRSGAVQSKLPSGLPGLSQTIARNRLWPQRNTSRNTVRP